MWDLKLKKGVVFLLVVVEIGMMVNGKSIKNLDGEGLLLLMVLFM